MNRQPFEKPPRWWAPRLSPLWVTLLRPLRRREQRKRHRLVEVEVRGAEKVRSLLDSNYGVLITPNHCSHADCFTLYEAADRIGSPLYAMMAWQVFGRGNWLRRQLLRVHGAFSVDREGADLSALRQARHVLQNEPFPLAVFPEGEVYHLNDRVTPFREGPAAMAIMAARKANRPIACVPCAMRYSYVEDPTSELLPLLDRLEEAMHWRPRPHESMQERIYKLAEGMLALKELEVFGKTQSGLIPERVNRLIQLLLGRIETKYGLCGDGRSVPERVKTARQTLIALMHQGVGDEASRLATTDELDDLFLVVQAFSYPGDYVRESPTIERMAETLDKFEEDLLGAKTASIRGERRAVVSFGDPVILQAGNSYHASAEELTSLLQDSVEQLLGTPRRQSQTA